MHPAENGGGTATGSSSQVTLSDTSKTWTSNQWATYTAVITGSVNASNVGAVRTISGNTADTLTVSSNFPVAIQAGDTYYITMNTAGSDYGTATGGATTSVIAALKTWTTNAWAGYYVKMTSGANAGLRSRIESNDATTLTIPAAEAFPDPVGNGDKFYITSNRHFMRINNAENELCVDCHYYRTPGSKPGGTISQTDVRTWDGNKKSHPIAKNLSQYNAGTNPNGVQDGAQFVAVPLEPQAANWAVQGGSRGHLNGGTDTNLTNNITFGIDGTISCLSCHNIHYSDSNASTVDTPSGYAP